MRDDAKKRGQLIRHLEDALALADEIEDGGWVADRFRRRCFDPARRAPSGAHAPITGQSESWMPENGTFRDASAGFPWGRLLRPRTSSANQEAELRPEISSPPGPLPSEMVGHGGHLGQAEPGLSLIEVTQHAASQRATSDQVCSKVVAPKKSPRCVQATISVRI